MIWNFKSDVFHHPIAAALAVHQAEEFQKTTGGGTYTAPRPRETEENGFPRWVTSGI